MTQTQNISPQIRNQLSQDNMQDFVNRYNRFVDHFYKHYNGRGYSHCLDCHHLVKTDELEEVKTTKWGDSLLCCLRCRCFCQGCQENYHESMSYQHEDCEIPPTPEESNS